MSIRELIPWRTRNPLASDADNPFTLLHRDIDALFHDFARTNGWSFPAEALGALPPMNVSETPEGFHVSLELPGMDRKDVAVRMEQNSLVLTGKKETEKEEKGRDWHRRERTSGEFRRVIPLPADIDPAKIEASFAKGVLTVDVPKSREALGKTRTIEIKSV